MYIDFHCHTKKTKSSEPDTRNIDKERFVTILSNKGVGIVAITNHNQFDISQYADFAENEQVIVWPGVEFDVVGNVSSAHCIVICNPEFSTQFSDVVIALTREKHPDSVKIPMELFVESFKALDVIMIVHYGRKKPSFEQSDFDKMKELCSDSVPLFIEVQNLRSAGIMIAYNMRTLIGSDIRNWDNYGECILPELKFPIDNFNRFKLALKKEFSVIQSFISQKKKETIFISPFSDLNINLDVYSDINIFIGGKGTGKTKILEKIHEYYKSQGISDIAHYYAQNKSDSYKDIIKEDCTEEDFLVLGIADDKAEYQKIANWTEKSVTPTSEYFKWAKSKDTTQYEKKFGYKDATFNEVITSIEFDNAFLEYKKIVDNFSGLEEVQWNKYLEQEEVQVFLRLIEKIKVSARQNTVSKYCNYQSSVLLKNSIKHLKDAFQMSSSVVSVPMSPGLTNLFQNALDISKSANKIFDNLCKDSIEKRRSIGFLQDKGTLFSVKSISINPDHLNSSSKYLKSEMNISTIKDLKKHIKALKEGAISLSCGTLVKNVVDHCRSKAIKSSKDLTGISSKIVRENNEIYNPSNGEQSMIVLSNALIDNNKSIYILDEPENSVGHVYINNMIVPRLKELSRLGKKVFISTHDANIAIRTLPYQTIYREDKGDNQYKTYFGSPFVDDLVDITDPSNKLKWSEISLDTLEGGMAAFIEREETYFGKS